MKIDRKDDSVPKKLETKLKATARRRGYGAARARRYIYGTMTKIKAKRH